MVSLRVLTNSRSDGKVRGRFALTRTVSRLD